MTKNNFLFCISFLGLCSCSHNLKFANNHFVVPVTAENSWNGHISAAATGVTNVTVINDITTNPPVRNKVLINEEVNASDALFLNNFGVNGSLSLLPSLEAYVSMGTWGLRWQFLNHGMTRDQWVAAVQVGYGSKEQSTNISGNSGYDTAKSEIKTKEAGISVGYRMLDIVPYGSYVYNAHDVKTTVEDAGASFGPYDDHGVHQSISLGLTSYRRGIDYGAEVSMTQIEWDRSDVSGQLSLGGKIGYAW